MQNNTGSLDSSRFVTFRILGLGNVICLNVGSISAFWPDYYATGAGGAESQSSGAAGSFPVYIQLFNGQTHLVHGPFEDIVSKIYASDMDVQETLKYWRGSVEQLKKAG
jgi:hypothetical protein